MRVSGSYPLFLKQGRCKVQFDANTYKSLVETIFKNRRLRVGREDDGLNQRWL